MGKTRLAGLQPCVSRSSSHRPISLTTRCANRSITTPAKSFSRDSGRVERLWRDCGVKECASDLRTMAVPDHIPTHYPIIMLPTCAYVSLCNALVCFQIVSTNWSGTDGTAFSKRTNEHSIFTTTQRYIQYNYSVTTRVHMQAVYMRKCIIIIVI